MTAEQVGDVRVAPRPRNGRRDPARAAGEFGERDVQRTLDEALLPLGGVAPVRDQRRLVGGQPAGLLPLVRQCRKGALGLAQVAADLVEADPGEPGDDPLLAVLRRDHEHLLPGADDRARPLGEPAVRGHVDPAAQIAGREVLR